jgi:IS1 family transposase
MAVARDTGLIVGQAVSQERRLETLQTLADTLPPAEHYASDGLVAYAEVIWPQAGMHLLSVGKADTHTVESLNANLRAYLARLARSSRCFSRSLEALQRAVRLFAYHYNQRQRLYLAHPAYHGRLPLLF